MPADLSLRLDKRSPVISYPPRIGPLDPAWRDAATFVRVAKPQSYAPRWRPRLPRWRGPRSVSMGPMRQWATSSRTPCTRMPMTCVTWCSVSTKAPRRDSTRAKIAGTV